MMNQNFISVDRRTAINSYGQEFTVGETVRHEDDTAGTATILEFNPMVERNEVRAYTTRGYAHIDFLVKIHVTPDPNKVIVTEPRYLSHL